MGSIQRLSPIDNRITWHGSWATSTEIDAAYERSRHAAKSWARKSVTDRIDLIQRYAQALERNKDAIAHCITLESGKPLWESKQEVMAAKSKVDNSIDALKKRRSECSSGSASLSNVIRYHPLGTVLVLGPYNLPLHLPGAHIVPSLLAGNTVVFKPSEKTPAVGDWIARCWQEAGLPDGVLETLHGAVEVAKQIVDKPDLAGVFFTGSHRGGVALHKQLAGRPDCLLALEMGGNNPLVVDGVRNVDASLQVIVQSCFITSGQRCTCARRLIVVESPENRQLIEKLAQAVKKIRVGNPLQTPEPFMGCLVSSEACESMLIAQSALRDRGAQPLSECKRMVGSPNSLTPGLFEINADLIDDEEHFGPLTTVMYADDFDHAIHLANATKYGLSAGLLSDDSSKFQRFVENVNAGIINWNSPTTGASGIMPFGGVRASGNHRPSGYFAADYCSYPKASVQANELQASNSLPPGLEELA
ncbi:MAG: succinylglutamate-semialdehyde dehydrogenase [Pirellula sp.]|jgi:succinylglutamic semialdehyde dehydrogenase|nr:succinylglutamate-semialdehyde dehydrogenase [Pirellula sp.]